VPELAAFQDAFAASLTADPTPDAAPGLRVYRNTIAQGLIDVLAAAFPTVERLMGEGWFAEAALAYARAHPPASPLLAEYGEGFPAFLHRDAGEESYLRDVARIDRAWSEAHIAADAEPLREPDFDAVPRFHPGARLLAFDLPAVTLWRLNRPPAPVLTDPVAPDWVPEACLVSRPADQVIVTVLDADGLDFVIACRAGATFGEAAVSLLQRRPDADLAPLIARLLAVGAFAEPRR
jgi:hypothetical protein